MKIGFFFILFFVLNIFAQVPTEAPPSEPLPPVGSRGMRGSLKYYAYANYSPVDLILPGKMGLTLGKISDTDHTWELEYLRGSVSVPFIVDDLGEMTDERISYIRRDYYGTESFNFSYGLSYHIFSLHLGSKLMSSIAPQVVPSIDLIQVESLGFNLAVGNRWILNERWTFGADWFSWSQPVLRTKYKNSFVDYVTDPNDKETVDKAVKLISYLPRFAIVKLQLGYAF